MHTTIRHVPNGQVSFYGANPFPPYWGANLPPCQHAIAADSCHWRQSTGCKAASGGKAGEVAAAAGDVDTRIDPGGSEQLALVSTKLKSDPRGELLQLRHRRRNGAVVAGEYAIIWPVI